MNHCVKEEDNTPEHCRGVYEQESARLVERVKNVCQCESLSRGFRNRVDKAMAECALGNVTTQVRFV